MRATRILMGMPITVDVVEATDETRLEPVFSYFGDVERRFSTYRDDSEIEAINDGRLDPSDYSKEMREIFELAEQTRDETFGFFDILRADGRLDPSGIVKGWAIRNAAQILTDAGARNFFIDAGGDIQASGTNPAGKEWSVGIRSPFNSAEIIKVVYPRHRGIATSGTYVRGQHIYNPHAPDIPVDNIVSLTVIGSDILEADRFATAAFAMGTDGIAFIERTPGLEGYVVHSHGIAIATSGFEALCAP